MVCSANGFDFYLILTCCCEYGRITVPIRKLVLCELSKAPVATPFRPQQVDLLVYMNI
jgi:hypothetical protein